MQSVEVVSQRNPRAEVTMNQDLLSTVMSKKTSERMWMKRSRSTLVRAVAVVDREDPEVHAVDDQAVGLGVAAVQRGGGGGGGARGGEVIAAFRMDGEEGDFLFAGAAGYLGGGAICCTNSQCWESFP